jgi:predicted PurR-regulated permease PerM
MNDRGQPLSHRQFVERLVVAIVVLGLVALLWQLRGLLILVFGAVLAAVILTVIAAPIAQRLHLPRTVALTIAVVLAAALFAIAFGLFGREVAAQASLLEHRVPEAWRAIETRLDAWGLGEPLAQWTQSIRSGGGVAANLGGIAMSVGSALADTLLVLVGGVYLAAQPDLYRDGLIKLIPERGRALCAEALDDSGRALRLWLRGQLVSMILVGLLTGFGLWLIGVPSALTLGLLAAILEFIPFAGPIIAAVPALVLALAAGPEMAFWVVILYLVVQQIEGNVIQPIVQERAVDLPPALLLFSIVAGGLVFGIVGVIFAAPLTVVIYVMVKRLYVREALHTATPIPGEKEAGK